VSVAAAVGGNSRPLACRGDCMNMEDPDAAGVKVAEDSSGSAVCDSQPLGACVDVL